MVSRPTYKSGEKETGLSLDNRTPISPEKSPKENLGRTKGFSDPWVKEIIFYKRENYS